MQPTPPPRRFSRRNRSLPTNTSKPSVAKLRASLRVLARSAGAVLHAGDDLGYAVQEPLDEGRPEPDLGDGGDVVQVHSQSIVAHPLDHLGERAEEPVVRDPLVVERRQDRTPAQPRRTACAVSRTVSGSAQQPVPGRSRSAGSPPRGARRGATPARPPRASSPRSSSRTARARRSRGRAASGSAREPPGSGARSVRNGVSTGARPPVRRGARVGRFPQKSYDLRPSVRRAPAQTTPRSCSASTSPSSIPSTSDEHLAGVLRRAAAAGACATGVRERRMGEATTGTDSPPPRSTPRAGRGVGPADRLNTCPRSLMGPAGTSAASSARTHAPVARRGERGASSARSSPRSSTLAAFVANLGSRASSGRPRTSHKPGELRVVPDRHDEVTVPRREGLVGHDARVGVAEAPRRAAGDEEALRLVRERRHLHVEEGEVDVLPAAAPLALGEGGEHRGGGVHAGEEVRERDADLHRRAVRLSRDAHEPADGLDEEVVAGAIAVRTALAEAADGAVDEPGVHGGEVLVREATAGEGADLVVLEHDVRPRGEAADEGLPLGAREVDGHRALAPVRAREVGRLARRRPRAGEPGRSPTRASRRRPGPLDLDAPRRRGPRAPGSPTARRGPREVEDADVREGGRFASGALILR